MTRDEILNVVASRDLDALISVKVFGKLPSFALDNFPHYSTDISAAWEVVEKLRDPSDDEPDFWVITDEGKKNGWTVSSYWAHHDGNIDNFHIRADTAPLAICRAALLATIDE